MPSINAVPSLYQRIKLGLIAVNHKSPTKHRFWRGVDKSGPIHPGLKTRCWLWTAFTDRRYGKIIAFGEQFAHRVSWVIHFGPVPNGLCVLHHCDNPSCVNPKHLFLGTQQDNMTDMNIKGRHSKGETHGSKTRPEKVARGEAHGRSKLTGNDVLEIRRLYKTTKLSQRKLAIMFDVSQVTIGKIILRELWKHI